MAGCVACTLAATKQDYSHISLIRLTETKEMNYRI